MLTESKKAKMLEALKSYKKRFLDKDVADLDESGTRILINHFLSEVLGYSPLEEIKTEFMIRGTYADYVVQTGGVRHFLVEVKAISLTLSEKHIRQTVNYGANEGIEFALLTNGRTFDLYKIIFSQPIDSFKMFSVELSDLHSLRHSIEYFQFLHKDAVGKNSLKCLWNRCEATGMSTIAGILCSQDVISTVRKLIKAKYGEKCEESHILKAIQMVITDQIDLSTIKPYRVHKDREKQKAISKNETAILAQAREVSAVPDVPAASDN